MAKVMKTMDGNTAAAHCSYAFTEIASIYPITPSSPMAESVEEWSSQGKKNIFGQTVTVTELQSEAGAAGTVHGSLQAGALTTTYTASQGLLLMIPNMYKLAGELLPAVFHVSARSLATHALNIFGDHSDVMACRQTGFAMLATGSVQEVMDLGGVAHLAAIKARMPFLHFFDGFRTSHEIQKVEVMDYEHFDRLLDKEAVQEFRDRALNPEAPVLRGTAQNPDVFFQGREVQNKFYDAVPDIVADYMKEISDITGREYKPFNYYGAPDAKRVVIAMGSVTESLEETVDYLVARGEKVGIIKIHLYRPFSPKYFFDVLPETVKKIAVLDRTKEPGALGEPLFEEIRALFYGRENSPLIVGGRYGLGSKDVTPTYLKAVFENLNADEPKNGFTIGINDDVTFTSLNPTEQINVAPKDITSCKFWGFGSDGTVGANKDAIKIIGDNTDLYAQGYFAYDSKKSGGITISHLRFGKTPIRSTYLIDQADYIACHKQAYIYQYDVIEGLKEGGTFLLNCNWDPSEVEEHLPASLKKHLAEKKANFYIINAIDIAAEVGLGHRTNMVTQSAFFKLANVIPYDEAVGYIKTAIKKTYGKKGDAIVNMNNAAVDRAAEALVKIDVPITWTQINVLDEVAATTDVPEFVKNVIEPMNQQQGDKLPVSTFIGMEDGTFPQATAKYEKRGIAIKVPEWVVDNCIQCNQCALVCPHAAIRPFLLNEEDVKNAPENLQTKKAIGKQFEGLEFRIQVSPYDCAGCGSCADVCPAKEKALVMKNLDVVAETEADNWNYLENSVDYKDNLMSKDSVKGSQFAQPLFEFSGACAGCGETPYAKLITQLFGDRMMIANATGCSSIWGGSAPSMPYCTNKEGKGPAWANSLFEDNAEFGYGMLMGSRKNRERIAMVMEQAIEANISAELTEAMKEWIANKDNGEASKEATAKLLPLLEQEDHELVKEILKGKNYLIKQSQWIFGGDGWSYDIGFGGVDHVLASGEDINIFVFDTEVYSNTGGQAAKSTPTGAVAKFAASGKKIKKKDLGMIAATYGYVYVAQIAMGANMNQTLKAIKEAESYPGPSLIIAYAPCVNHGIRKGMGKSMQQMKDAVDSGYWHLWRFNPLLEEEGKNPFVLDSKEPTGSFRDFIMGEVRYTSLLKAYPDHAEDLFVQTEKNALARYEGYKKKAAQ
ncbi:pyruvate-ferredoxin/flavodoxin oxidoreductase [Desulfonispora thiosulfatigenes DSM 11270]|uniref:Pyruvate:ferredoxin oxidoreductase n=1 Tax=Desulfonispora thiosulfatigenes DSM 11270 TaxID=656914 RepID=A0A1W1UQI6_DESTI|nr:pyruvate:ferredoxin (flavodoxin) oxidoreductase [Desulfonispora thiosulfatigenes]SMB83330.1 pyruvate-ferredoxin/flavodoxin oxidoreductase [Desulfonispora thiosulfatigenes DSM 11270]